MLGWFRTRELADRYRSLAGAFIKKQRLRRIHSRAGQKRNASSGKPRWGATICAFYSETQTLLGF